MTRSKPFARLCGAALLLPMVGGCNAIVMNPAGDVAVQQRDLILISMALMLLIVIPVMAATAIFAWRYRASNRDATYDPDFDHSTMLELGIWSAPLLIIIALGAVTWSSTHLLDPYRGLGRAAPGVPLAAGVKPLEVQVVALDWKWLFIYPDLGIATVNELAAPANVPIHFRISGSSVMNSFYVPALAGQIYAMPGMETALNAVLNKTGEYEGLSANYSGAGFSDMHFPFHGMDQAAFDKWVAQVRSGGGALDRAGYVRLEKPSEKEPIHHFAQVQKGLFDLVVNRCVVPGTPCMSAVMAHDQHGGGNPHEMRPGAGNPPVNEAGPMHGEKAKGAIFKSPEEKGSAPHLSKPRSPGTPGTQQQGSQKNRDMSFLAPLLPNPVIAPAGLAGAALA